MLKIKSNKVHPQIHSENQSLIQSPRKKQIIKSIKQITEQLIISQKSQLHSNQLPFRLSSYNENTFNRNERDLDTQQRFNQNIFPDKNAIQEILNSLKKGYFFKKYSKNTRQPHQKFVYLSQDQNFLCWKSYDKNDEKKIALTKIRSINVGQIGPGLLKHKDSIYPQKCILIITSQRSLEFQAKNLQLMNLFASELRVGIEMVTKFYYRSLPIL